MFLYIHICTYIYIYLYVHTYIYIHTSICKDTGRDNQLKINFGRMDYIGPGMVFSEGN